MATVKHHGRFILRLSPLARFGKPAIFNTDRGSQSTSAALYVDIYLKGDVDGREARARIGAWTAFYNTTLPHQALCNRTPMAVWRAGGDIDEVVNMTLLVPRSLDNPGRVCPDTHSRNSRWLCSHTDSGERSGQASN